MNLETSCRVGFVLFRVMSAPFGVVGRDSFTAACAWLGLAKNLKRTPDFKIQRARLAMVFKRAQERIERSSGNPRWRESLEKEYLQFKETVNQWQQLQVERVQQSRQRLASVLEQNALATRYRELERELKQQRKRVTLLTAQFIG